MRPYAGLILVSVVAGGLAGAGTVWLIALVNAALNSDGGMAPGLLLGLIGLCGATLVTHAGSDIATNLVGQRVVAEIRIWLGRRILGAPVDALEQYRSHRILPVLTHDVDMISDVAFIAAPLAIALIIALGCFGYLAWLSPPLCLMVLMVLGLGSWVQYVARRRGMAGFEASRNGEDELHKAYRAITEGAKELKINRLRRERLFSRDIAATADRIRTINVTAINTFVAANAFGSALFFVAIALALAWRSVVPIEPQALSGFVLVLLFLRGPVDQIMNTLPVIGRAQVAFRRIADLSAHFASTEPDVGAGPAARPPARIESLRLDGVAYAFPGAKDAPGFQLGPVDLAFEAGRLTFVVGDNGSGKTTLIKLLLGLYAPQQGQVVVDGKAVTAESRDDYRQLFSAVLSDFHLFDEIATGSEADAGRLAAYLDRLELAGKVGVQDGRFSTTDLSTGQRKRLALLHAWAEDRPVIVFDEWAADQDPTFRQLFYDVLLPELKARGKVLIVVSHDERYFGTADHLVRLSRGRIADATASAHGALAGPG
ncbi:ABC transporter ATP-binding protein YojI [bacterium YEK0313]|nr:ABC transporter ATP-binding protein YojI [bacterium YEK0313]